jgi:hypothetical protein
MVEYTGRKGPEGIALARHYRDYTFEPLKKILSALSGLKNLLLSRTWLFAVLRHMFKFLK